jgi:hypothetical protein
LCQMTQSLCPKLFIKGAFVRAWGRKQALEDSHQEASQKMLSKGTLLGAGPVCQELSSTPVLARGCTCASVGSSSLTTCHGFVPWRCQSNE